MLLPRRLRIPLLSAALWACLGSSAWSQPHPWEPARLDVSIERSDPFSEFETRYQWETVGENHHSPRGDVSAAELDALRDMVLATRHQSAPAGQPLPPQPSALVQRILQRFPWLAQEPLDYTAEQLAAELAASATDPLASAAGRYTVTATLPGEPVLLVALSNTVAPGQPRSGGLPTWTVGDGRTSWNSYSPQLAVVLAYLLKGTPHHDIVERVRSRNSDFLERKARSEGERIASQRFARQYRSWPGYAAVEPYVAEARLHFPPGEEAFYWVQLKLQGLRYLNTAALGYPAASGPQGNWKALATELERVEARIAETGWLRRALEQAATLELRWPDEQDRASWREAGLPGQPDCALVSSHGALSEKFLLDGPQQSVLLLFPSEPTLQALSVRLTPRPSFLRVAPNGDTEALELFP